MDEDVDDEDADAMAANAGADQSNRKSTATNLLSKCIRYRIA